ncbi:Alpha/Beta hydrolase protein [Globomyces pollinis-pini]|nr:Alpha/Beta hydrolase protein [Globomyces pollinis-pini]
MSLLSNELYFVYNDAGNETIGKIDLNTNEYTKITDEFCAIGGIRVVQFGDRAILTLRASQFDKPASLFGLDLSTKEVLQFATSYDVQDLKGYISEHQYFTFPTRDGSSSYLYYYPPTNPDYTGLDGELPPCIVYCHGGPNELARCGFDWEVQYVTSRGFAYVAVNYGGTPSFGKHHLERLDKLVGVVDVADTCDAAKYLASIGLVDRERLLVEGISAGGYITNCCLMFEPDVFKAGCSSCGLSDMKIMVENYKNHPLSSVGEPFYIDFYGGKPEDIPEVYYNRSPLNFTEKFKGSLLLTHAKDDKNVAYEHTQALYDRLKEAGKSVELLPFATGGHPFFDIPEMKAVIFERKVPFYLESFTK